MKRTAVATPLARPEVQAPVVFDYPIPKGMIGQQLRPQRPPPDLFKFEDGEMERHRRFGGRCPSLVIVHGVPDPELDVRVLSLDIERLESMLKCSEQEATKHAVLLSRLSGDIEESRWSYAGWLATNAEFNREQDSLIRQYDADIREAGFPDIRDPREAAAIACVQKAARTQESDAALWDRLEQLMCPCLPHATGFIEGFRSFYEKWAIVRLAAPWAPVPPQPRWVTGGMPGHPPHLDRAIGRLELPRHHRHVAAERQRQAILDQQAAGAPKHLLGWYEELQKSEQSPEVIRRWSRVFKLQLWWRALHRRCPEFDKLRITRRRDALAKQLGCDQKTIKRDLDGIQDRLGEGWEHCSLPTGLVT